MDEREKEREREREVEYDIGKERGRGPWKERKWLLISECRQVEN